MRIVCILTRLLDYLFYILLTFTISSCSLFNKKQDATPTILATIDSTSFMRNADLETDNLQFEILFFSKSYFFGNGDMSGAANTSIYQTTKIKDKQLSSFYRYLIIPNEVIKDQIEVDKNIKFILLVLKIQDKIIAEKIVSFDIKKLKILNISLDRNSITVQP